MILSAVLVAALGTTGVMAKGNTGNLLKLASKQETLSQNIVQAYKKQDRGSSAIALISALESGQMKLKSNIDNPELDDLLTYLKTCLNDLKTVVKKPYSTQNARLVGELSASLSEGSRYIAKSLRENS
jgi:hypothetical protein